MADRGAASGRSVDPVEELTMLLSSVPRRILADREPIDMRKSFNDLIGVVRSQLAEDPLSATGFVLFAKRLEQGRFVLPGDDAKQLLHEQMLMLILDGIALGKRRVVC
jgi:transposase